MSGEILAAAREMAPPAVAFLKEWQTLVSALIALLAARWTIGTMRKQLKAEDKRHSDALERKRMSARAQIPSALAEISKDITECSQAMLDRKEVPAKRPERALAILTAAIEHVDQDAALSLAGFASEYQVWSSRLTFLDVVRNGEVDMVLFQAAKLSVIKDRLLEYGRQEKSYVPLEDPTADELMSGLRGAVGFLTFVKMKNRLDSVQKRILRIGPAQPTE